LARKPTLASRRADPRTRPRRGAPEETRRRLVAAAGVLFNRDGYDGTDSNAIAREAGYAPGTFYKHFEDKRAAFVAVYDEWVAEEWREIERVLASDTRSMARELVAAVVEMHARWRGFRRSLRALAAKDPEVRTAHLRGRARQLEAMGPRDHARHLFLLYALERAADALADGEPEALGVGRDAFIALLEREVTSALGRRLATAR
jgi:AcrR family transcriptional regulator